MSTGRTFRFPAYTFHFRFEAPFAWMFLGAMCVLMSPLAAFSQTQITAGLTGTVTDTTGAVIPGVMVSLTNTGTGAKREQTTNETGTYVFTLLQPGAYSLALQRSGFALQTRAGILLEVNQIARVNVIMLPGSVSQTIEVNSAPLLLETSTSAVGQVITPTAVSNLPLNGRNFVQLAILAPGTTGMSYGPTGTIGGGNRPDDPRAGIDLMSDGNREMSNNFMVDGVDDNFRRNALITVRPNVDDIQEFKIQTNLFGAQQGRSSGATVDVLTKSGTNQFHGDVFEYVRNDLFDGRDYFNPTTAHKPEYRQNQFGGSMGGPVMRDRVFFFGDYEGFRSLQGTPTSVNTVPTPAERTGDFSGIAQQIFDPASIVATPGTASGYTRTAFPGNKIPSNRFDSVTSRLIQAYPLPTSLSSPLINNESTNPVRTSNYDSYDGRVDYTMGPSDTAFLQFMDQRAFIITPSTFGPLSIPGISGLLSGLGENTTYAQSSPMDNYLAALSWTHVFSPRFVVTTEMGYNRFAMVGTPLGAPASISPPGLGTELGVPNSNQEPDSFGLPAFDASGYTGIGGGSYITTRYADVFNPLVNFTLTLGRHTLMWGENFVRPQIIDFQDGYGNGYFDFDSTFDDDPNNPASTGNAMADFLLGAVGGEEQAYQIAWAGTRILENGAYFADDWKATRNLTLNLGLRWEYMPPPVEAHNKFSNFDTQTGKVLIAGVDSGEHVGIGIQYTMFAPRFGFAYDLGNKTVFRGGFGIFYNATGNGGALYRLHRQLPFGATNQVVVNEDSPTYMTVAEGLPPNSTYNETSIINNPKGSWYSIPHSYRDSYQEQFSFGVERQLPASMVLKASYVGNLGRHLDYTYNINQPVPGPGALPPRELLYTLAPGVVADDYAATSGYSSYNSLQVTLERRYTSGLSLLGSYTYSHALDDVPLQEGGGDDGPIPQDPRCLSCEYASSSFDIRQRYTQTVTYELPYGTGMRFRSRNSLLNDMAGNWQLNAIFTTQTGLPGTPTLQSPVANTGSGSWPDRVPGVSITVPNPSVHQWFNTSFNVPGAAWADPPLYTFGDAGRNILRGPHITDLDFSVFKNYHATERFEAQLRGDFFNIFNHPQFALPNTTIGNPAAGTITSDVSGPREFQLAARLIF
jgi:hypothetical protein